MKILNSIRNISLKIKKIGTKNNNSQLSNEITLSNYISNTLKDTPEYITLKKQKNKFSLDSIRFPVKENILFFIIIALGLLLFGTDLLGNLLFNLTDICSSGLYSISLRFKKYAIYGRSYQDLLINIHVGIGAILIGAFFLIAQSLSDGSDSYKGRVLLSESFVFPVVVLEVIYLMIIVVPGVENLTIIAVLALLVIGFGTIVVIYKIVGFLISERKLERAKKHLIRSIIKKSFGGIVEFDIIKRISQNHFFSKIKEYEPFIQFSYFSKEKGDDYIQIYSEKIGNITDVNFENISLLIKKLEEIMISDSGAITNIEDGTINDKRSATKQNGIIFLKGVPLEGVFSKDDSEAFDGSTLLYIDKKHIDPGLREANASKINKLANAIYTVSDKYSDVQKEAKYEMQKLKDSTIKDIHNLQIGELSKKIDLYGEIIKEYFLLFKKYGGGFDQKQAESERGMFIGRLSFMDRLMNDIRSIFKEGVESKHFDIVSEVIYLPFKFIKLSIRHSDHLIFQTFVNYTRNLYKYGLKYISQDETKDIGTHLIDRSYRYISEIYDYTILPKYEEGNLSKENFKSYYLYILKSFQQLLKDCFENNKKDDFEIVLNKVKKLFLDNFYSHRKIEEITEFMESKVYEITFGLLYRILHSEQKDKRYYFDKLANILPNDIVSLTKIFNSIHNFDTERFRGWSNREMEGHHDGEVRGINILEKLEKVYAILGLRALSTYNGDKGKLALPYNRSLYHLAGGSRDLLSFLNEIKDNGNDFITDKQSKEVGNFILLLENVIKMQEADDLELKRNTEVDQGKIQQFYQNFINNYNHSGSIREVFSYYDNLRDYSNKNYTIQGNSFGFNQYFDKASFLPESADRPTVYMGIKDAFGYGKSFSQGQDAVFISSYGKILKKSKLSKFKDILQGLLDKNGQPVMILLNSGYWDLEQNQQLDIKRNDITPSYSINTNLYPRTLDGFYNFNGNSIPFYRIYNNSAKEGIYLLDAKQMGELIIYNPVEKKENISHQKGHFYYNVRGIIEGSEEYNQIISNKDKRLKGLSKEEMKNQLKENIIIEILMKFQFEKYENIEGYYFEFDDK